MSERLQSRRDFLGRLAAGTAAAAALPYATCGGTAGQPPNVVFIMADDLGYGDLGCYGQQAIQTPRLDRMAAEGMRFTDHYAGSTVCAPSRCSLLTGLHQGHARVRGNSPDMILQPEDFTFGELFQRAGYRTGVVGKWGVGTVMPPDDPLRHGFDYHYGYISMWHAHNYWPDFLYRNGEKVPLRNVVDHPETFYKPGQEPLVGVATKRMDYSHDLCTQEALAFIERNQSRPFLLYVPYTIPHANNEAKDKGMEVPDYGIYKDRDWPEPQKGHAAMISRMDRDVGAILDKLRELGLEENTLVIFTSDNGPHKEGGADPAFNDSNGPLQGMKRDLTEGGIRVPMIARWPGRVPVGTSNLPCAFWDWLPTFADLTNSTVPVDVDGLSILPAILGEPNRQQRHDYLYWEFYERGFDQALRMGDWKALRKGLQGPVQLYNLAQDIGETTDVAAQHPDIVAKVREYLRTARVDSPVYPTQ
jgi:arylsulfatase A-like enzyme